MHTVLIIEDDLDMADLVRRELVELGLSAIHESDGAAGLARALGENCSLVVCDLGLPGMGGLEVVRRLRTQKPSLAILILTGETEDVKMLLGFEVGADEYIRKPFNVLEFQARVRSLLRRTVFDPASHVAPGATGSAALVAAAAPNEITFGELSIHFDKGHVYINSAKVPLTRTEFELLAFLVRNRGKVYSREVLIEHVLGGGPAAYEQSIRSHISNLRSKLNEAGASKDFIVTERGFGYRFVQD